MIESIRTAGVRLLVLAVAWVAVPSAHAEQSIAFQVVIHASNPTSEITRFRLSKIFLKQVKKWDHDVWTEPVDQADDSPVRAAFSKAIHGRSVASIKNYWQRQIFSGRSAVPPPELSSDQEVLDHVRHNPGAVGYVSSEARLGTDVKVLEIIREED